VGFVLLGVGSVLVFGISVALYRSDSERRTNALLIGLFSGIAVFVMALIVLAVAIWGFNRGPA
jgi:hypothetical protein